MEGEGQRCAVRRATPRSRSEHRRRRAASAVSRSDRRFCSQVGPADRQRAVRRHLGASRALEADRSLVTVAALIALNRPDQLRSHLVRAPENGVTQEELIETITHLAFYAGWPNAVNAIAVAKDVFEKK